MFNKLLKSSSTAMDVLYVKFSIMMNIDKKIRGQAFIAADDISLTPKRFVQTDRQSIIQSSFAAKNKDVAAVLSRLQENPYFKHVRKKNS